MAQKDKQLIGIAFLLALCFATWWAGTIIKSSFSDILIIMIISNLWAFVVRVVRNKG